MRLGELERYNSITVQCHDNPDADALASGFGVFCYFRSKGKDVRLVYSGENRIQKSNLRLMVEKLELPVEYITRDEWKGLPQDGLLITVDCQYGAGNVTKLEAENVVVIDHHQVENASFHGVINPNLGSCATLVWKLLMEENFDVDSVEQLGTALYYGLYTDTNQFSEVYNPLDMDMREALHVDKSLITLFRNSNLSLKELEIAGIAMIRSTFNDDYGFAVIKSQPCDPNILGLISDFLLQVDAIRTCVVFSEAHDGYKFSVRSCVKEVNASELAAFLAQDIGSGGGHYEKAGGFISLRLYEENFPTLHAEAYFNNRMTQYFDSFDLIYAREYQADVSKMKRYRKKSIPVGYVKADNVFPVGTPVTVRTLEEDIELTVDEDLYLIIGSKGEVYSSGKEKFERFYRPLDQRYVQNEKLEYVPIIKDRVDGSTFPLTDYARVCVSTGNVDIYARELERGVKVFTTWEKDKYMLGKPGDYLAVRCDDLHNVYVVEREMFVKSYDEISPEELLAEAEKGVL